MPMAAAADGVGAAAAPVNVVVELHERSDGYIGIAS